MEVNRVFTARYNRSQIFNEVVDSLIMIAQVVIMIEFTQAEIINGMRLKTDRLKGLLKGEI